MLSVVIATNNSEGVLVQTLAPLVSGAAAGIVREVVVTDAGSTDATALIADAAGCTFGVASQPLGERLRAAASGARAAWLLFLRPGVVLDTAWIEETRRFVQNAELSGQSEARAAVFRPAGGGDTLLPTLAEGARLIAAALGAGPRPQQGLLIAKSLYQKLGGHRGDDADPERSLLRRLGRRRLILLRSRTMLAAGQAH